MSTQNERELFYEVFPHAKGGNGKMVEGYHLAFEAFKAARAPLLSRIAELESRIDALSKDAEPDNGYAITHDPCRAYLSFFKDGVEVAHIGIEYILDGRFSQKTMTEKERELLLGIYRAAISAREGE